MPPRWLLGLDLGGGSIRCMAVDAREGRRVVAARGWHFDPAAGTAGLGSDLDLDGVWSLLREVVPEALAQAGARPEDVAGMAVSAQRFSSVVLAADGRVLLAVPNRDARAAAQWLGLGEERCAALHADTGLWPMSIHASARLLWLAKERPRELERAVVNYALSDWVNWRLCGVHATDPSQAGCSGLFSLAGRSWSSASLAALGLPARIFPPLRESSTRLGALASGAAQELGLLAGMAVSVGGGDTQCGLLGAGALAPGDAAWVAGTTAPLQLVVDTPLLDPAAALWSGHHVVPGRWVLECNGGPVGDSLGWISRLLFPEARQPELRLFAEADAHPMGASGLLSTLGADRVNPRSPGMPVGQITLNHLSCAPAQARPALARAVLEGVAYGVRADLERLESLAGTPVSELRLVGGLARSEVLARVLATVLGRPVVVPESHEATALGAALCAGVGSGLFRDLQDAASRLVRPRATYEPVAAERETAERVYAGWVELRRSGEEAQGVARRWVTPWVFEATGAGAGPQMPKQRPRVLVTARFDSEALADLRVEADVDYASFRDAGRLLRGDTLVEALQGYTAFVTEIDVVDVDSLARLPDLRIVASCRGDAVNVDVEACTAFGIPVLNAPGRNADAVADLTLAFILALSRKLPGALAFLRDPAVAAGDMAKLGEAFVQLQGRELWGKAVGLVGLGAVGRGVARRLHGFGPGRVMMADPYVTPERAALAGCEKVDLDTLLEGSDVVCLHAAVTDETRAMIGAAELARLKPGALLVNTARAALVDEPALLAALDGERLAGVALDTFAVEPPGADHPLVQHPKVLSTPHIGGNTVEVASHQGALIVRALHALLHGERPACLQNPEVLADFHLGGPRREPPEALLEGLRKRAGPAVTDLQRDKQKPGREPRSGSGRGP